MDGWVRGPILGLVTDSVGIVGLPVQSDPPQGQVLSPEAGPHDQLLGLVTTLLAQSTAAPSAEEGRPLDVLHALVRRAASVIRNAEWTSVTVIRSNGHPSTMTSSHPEALAADQVQYELMEGPCLAAADEGAVYVTGEVHRDPRWTEYGRHVHEQLGVSSVLAHRLTLLGEGDPDAALNVYSRSADAFDDTSVRQALVFATQCSLLVSAHLANKRADHLAVALQSNREIGVALGILMARHQVTRDQAFALLNLASQNLNRKMRDVASEVTASGELPEWSRRRQRG